jgi:hypothetical protein
VPAQWEVTPAAVRNQKLHAQMGTIGAGCAVRRREQ